MDLTTLRLEVRERLGELSADFFTNAEVDRAINEALRRFSAEERWPWLYTELTDAIATDTDEYDLPSDVGPNRLFAFSVTGGNIGTVGGQMLERVTPMEGFRLRHQYDGHTGVPRWYYVSRTNQSSDGSPPTIYTVRVIPTTDTSYDIEAIYLCVPPELSGASDEPLCPEEYQEAIPAWATGKLFLKEFQISQKASEQFSLYSKVLEQAKNDLFEWDADEVVAWGRKQPQVGKWSSYVDIQRRIPRVLGP